MTKIPPPSIRPWRRVLLVAALPILLVQLICLPVSRGIVSPLRFLVLTPQAASADRDLEVAVAAVPTFPRCQGDLPTLAGFPGVARTVSSVDEAEASIHQFLLVVLPLVTSQLCSSSL